MDDKELENLKRDEQHRQTMLYLNMIELWLRFGQAYLEITKDKR